MPEKIRFTLCDDWGKELLDVETDYDGEVQALSQEIFQLLSRKRAFQFAGCTGIRLHWENKVLEEGMTLAEAGLKNGAKVSVEKQTFHK